MTEVLVEKEPGCKLSDVRQPDSVVDTRPRTGARQEILNNKLVYRSNTVYQFEKYMGFHYYAVSNASNLAFKMLKKIIRYRLNLQIFKYKQKKVYTSQLRF